MRYETWDTILFSRDSHVPIQEFRTACYDAQDEYGRHLPTLTCYIASLPPSTPFRISVHSWTSKVTPTAVIESQRKANQRIVYTIQVTVDGVRAFHDFYEVSSGWPQEIVQEKRSIIHTQQQTSQQKRSLGFPPFHQNVLVQSFWDARDNSGRIKLLLSEQLIGKMNSSPGDWELGPRHDIVCFSFQHAPRDILEKAGISWPIRNLLYFPPMPESQPHISQAPAKYSGLHNPHSAKRTQSPIPKIFKSPFICAQDSEPHGRPNTAPIPHMPQFPKPPAGERNRGKAGRWENSFAESFTDPCDNASMMDLWRTQRMGSNSTTDVSMPDLLFASPSASKTRTSWQNPSSVQISTNKRDFERDTRNEREEKHVVVTLREDQLGLLVKALSPPKKIRRSEQGTYQNYQAYSHSDHSIPQTCPPKMGPMGAPLSRRPSTAGLALTTSYCDSNLQLRNISNKVSPTKQKDNTTLKEVGQSSSILHGSSVQRKENRNPSENRVATPHPFGRMPTPQNYMQSPVWGPSHLNGAPWESDTDMRDPSSLFSSLIRLEKRPQQTVLGKTSPTLVPTANGNVKSKKEGRGMDVPANVGLSVRHDQSLLPPSAGTKQAPELNISPQNTPEVKRSPHAHIEETSNLNEPKFFVPGHRSGMSSMERVETQLYSALGEELNSFNEHVASANLGCETLSGLEVFESPLMKRKRGTTSGGDRGRSPNTKLLREENADTGPHQPEMRGD